MLHDDNRLEYSSANLIPRNKKYLDEMDGIPVKDVWNDISQIQSGEKLDYATQKPVALLNRILKMFSNGGLLFLMPVLDLVQWVEVPFLQIEITFYLILTKMVSDCLRNR